MIPADEPLLRAAASILSIDSLFRLVEMLRLETPKPLKARLSFLLPFPIFIALSDQRGRMRQVSAANGKDWLRALGGGAFLLCWMILETCADIPALKTNHPLDHTFKFVLFVAAVEVGAQALCGLEHIAGFQTRPMVSRTWQSLIPAEFWRRWNDRVHAWLYRHVFQPAGGASRPGRAIWCVCLFSGAFHELMFGIATSRFDGYQFAFFTLQAPAIMASPRMKAFARRGGGARAALTRTATILWFWATSWLFFHGINRVIPIYYTSAPWLP